MTPTDRVRVLLTERKVFGRPLVFVDTPADRDAARGTGAVHVVGPDEDQPAYADMADWAINRRIRTVCGIDIHRNPLQGRMIGTFTDERLCRRCHHRLGPDAWLIFEDNTDARQQNAGAVIDSVRAVKEGRTAA
jgi:hypothetical protein